MPSLQSFTFQVRDDTDTLYDVTVVRHGPGHLSAHCTCTEARTGRYCDHCLRLLSGDASQLESDNALEVEVLEWWVACLDLKRTIGKVLQAQESGTLPPASVAQVFAHWPELTSMELAAAGTVVEVRGVA